MGPIDTAAPDSSVAETPHADRARFDAAAATAWRYVETQMQPATGLVNSVAGYEYATVWDIASTLAALHSARKLGLLAPVEYHVRMTRALATIDSLRLFDDIAFNKNYSTRTAAPAGLNDRDSSVTARGYGWSSIDIGRLLVWLRIVGREPRFAAQAAHIAARIDFSQLVGHGYLFGGELTPAGTLARYSEGRLGYEQYAAAGFALWGHPVDAARSLQRNTFPVTVLGVPLLADTRGGDHLTSEPFVLLGLELGWDAGMRAFAERVLRVQEARYHATGQLTAVSEDNLPDPPHYFYYYAINHHGLQFAVTSPAGDLAPGAPRWVSTKAALGWHALLPSAYTSQLADAVQRAADPIEGWGAGVYESGGAPVRGYSLNTAAVVLEAAAFSRTGRPLLY